MQAIVTKSQNNLNILKAIEFYAVLSALIRNPHLF